MGNPNIDVWDAIPAVVLHEAQLWIIEAMTRLDQPLSTVMLAKIIDQRAWDVTRIAHHVRRLHRFGLIELVEKRQVRGAIEKYYCLACPVPVHPARRGTK